jgi:hypothetical protein
MYVKGPVPPAVTLKMALLPRQTLWVDKGLTLALVNTDSVAQLVINPQAPTITTQYWPESAVTVAGRTRVLLLWPANGTPFLSQA